MMRLLRTGALLSALLLTFPYAVVTAQQNEVTTIRIYGGWGTFRETLTTIYDQFEAAHPNIRVEPHEIAGDMEALQVQLVGGAAPDIYMVRSETMPTFVNNGWAADLTPYFERDLDMADYLPAFGSMTFGGRYFGVPAEGGGYREDAMYVNRDLFQEAGIPYPGPEMDDALTFEQWIDISRRLTLDRNGDGEPEQWGTHFRPTRWYFFLPSNGVSVFNEDHTDTLIDSPAAIEVLDVLQQIHHTYRVSAPNSYWFENQGNVAMNILWRPRVAVAPDIIGDRFDWSVSPMPAGRAGSVGLTKMNPMAMNPDSDHPEAAWAFLRYLISEPAQRLTALEGRAVVLRSVALSPEFVFTDGPPYNLMPFLGGDAVDVSRQFPPPGVDRPEAEADARAALWRGEFSPEAAAEQMARAWREALRNR